MQQKKLFSSLKGTFEGNVAADPVLKVLDNGKEMVNFSVYVQMPHNTRKEDGNWVQENVSVAFAVAAFGYGASNVANSLKKGDRVTVRDATIDWKDPYQDDNGNVKRGMKAVVEVKNVSHSLLFSTTTQNRERQNNSGGGGGYNKPYVSNSQTNSQQEQFQEETSIQENTEGNFF